MSTKRPILLLLSMVLMAQASALCAQSIESAKGFYQDCQNKLADKQFESFILCFSENDRASMNLTISGLLNLAFQSNQVDPVVVQETQRVFNLYPDFQHHSQAEVEKIEVKSSEDFIRVLRMVNSDEGILAKNTVAMSSMDKILEAGGEFRPYSKMIDGFLYKQPSDWSETEAGVTAQVTDQTFEFKWDGARWWIEGVWQLQR